MNPHLSAEEMARWVAGERGERARGHLAECAVCATEAGRMEAALAEFGGALRRCAAPPAEFPRTARRAPRMARRVLAAAGLAALAAAPAWRYRRAQERVEAARADAILLEEVDAEVSEAVPGPMQPLLPLVSWNPKNDGNGETQ